MTMQTEFKLTLEQEGVLKKVLLTDAFDLELSAFSKSSDPYDFLINNTILLRFVFGALIGEKEPHPSVRKFILKLPQILALLHKATKKRDTTASYFAIVVDLLLRTPQEKKYAAETGHAQRFSSLMEENVNIRKIEGEDEMLYKSVQDARKMLIDSATNIYHDVSASPNGTDRLFDIITKCKIIAELPPAYRGVFSSMMTACIPRVEEICRDKGKVETRKKMYHNMPRRTITTVLTMTNPFKMVQSLSSLFLARPLGSHNLLQKMVETSTEYGRTLSLLKEAKKACNHDLDKYVDRIELFSKTAYEPLGDLDFSEEDNAKEEKDSFVQTVNTAEQRSQLEAALFHPGLPAPTNASSRDIFHQLSNNDISSLFRVLRLEKRRRDKIDIIDLFGEPDMIGVIKDLLPMICVPLGDIYAQVGVSDWLSECFKWLKCIIHSGEKYQKGALHKAELHKELYDGFYRQEEAHYQLIRNIVSADKDGVLMNVFRWIYKKFQIGDGFILDLEPIAFKNGEMDPAVREELDKLVAFENFRNHLWKQDFKKAQELKRPDHPVITKILLNEFMAKLQTLPIPSGFQARMNIKVAPPAISARSSPTLPRRPQPM